MERQDFNAFRCLTQKVDLSRVTNAHPCLYLPLWPASMAFELLTIIIPKKIIPETAIECPIETTNQDAVNSVLTD